MPQTYEKDGIIYFKEPYEVDYADWIFEHLDCDLRHIQKTKYPNGKIFRGMGAEEVNCID